MEQFFPFAAVYVIHDALTPDGLRLVILNFYRLPERVDLAVAGVARNMETLPDGKEKICTRVRVSCILSRTRTQQQENSFAFNHWTRLFVFRYFVKKKGPVVKVGITLVKSQLYCMCLWCGFIRSTASSFGLYLALLELNSKSEFLFIINFRVVHLG